MKFRTIVVTAGLCVSVLAAGCASSLAGQAEIVPGAALPTTSDSAPSPFPDPTTGESSSSESASSESSTSDNSTSTDVTENTPTEASSTGADDSSVGPPSATGIPGLSKDCAAVVTGISAFTTVLQGAGGTGTISQATVDEALKQLPASGLPARPQADIDVLRTTVSAAAGKTLTELGGLITDGKVVEALQDLSKWAQDNCALR